MGREITPQQRERILLKSILIQLAFAGLGLLLVQIIPKQAYLLPLSLAVLVGLFVSCIYAIPRLARSDEDLLWGYSATSMLIVLLAGFFYSIFLRESGVLGDRQEILFLLGLVLPLCVISSFLTYETLDFRKRDGKLSFHAKRFLGRAGLAAIFFVTFMVFVALLSFASPTGDVATGGLVLASLTTAVILYVLTRRPRTKDLLSKLEKGEW